MRLLIVEDDLDYANRLATDLTSLGHCLTLAGGSRDALLAMDRAVFDAIVLDRMMPELDGMDVVRRLRENGQQLPVLMLTALGQTADKVDGLDAGADDYVVKPASASEIDARLRALVRARGWTGRTSDTVQAGDIVVSPARVRAWRGGHPLDLTSTEFKLLTELVREAGGFVTRAMLFERVWNYDFEPSTNIVDGQIKTLRRKLLECGEDDPIVTKRGVGYMLRG